MAGILVMAAIPTGRRLISRVRVVQPKWLMATGAARIGALRRAPLGVRFVSRHEDDVHGGHKHHWSYVAVVGVAAVVVTLICFYLCLWLVRHQRRQRTPAPRQQLTLAPSDHQNAEEEEGDRRDEMKTTRPRGDGDRAKQTWSSESVELVVMAGEHVPTFVAHPVVQCPAPLPAQDNSVY